MRKFPKRTRRRKSNTKSQLQRSLRFQSLESRQLLAADIGTDQSEPAVDTTQPLADITGLWVTVGDREYFSSEQASVTIDMTRGETLQVTGVRYGTRDDFNVDHGVVAFESYVRREHGASAIGSYDYTDGRFADPLEGANAGGQIITHPGFDSGWQLDVIDNRVAVVAIRYFENEFVVEDRFLIDVNVTDEIPDQDWTDAVRPVHGDWQADEEGVGGDSRQERGDNGLTVIQTDVAPGLQYEIGVKAKTVEENTWANGFVVIDYRSEDDFIYAGLRSIADQWVIGHFDGDFNDLASLDQPVEAQQVYDLRVAVDGSHVSLAADGVFRVSHDFDRPLDQGAVGLANEYAFTHFTNFHIFQNTASDNGGSGVGIDGQDGAAVAAAEQNLQEAIVRSEQATIEFNAAGEELTAANDAKLNARQAVRDAMTQQSEADKSLSDAEKASELAKQQLTDAKKAVAEADENVQETEKELADVLKEHRKVESSVRGVTADIDETNRQKDKLRQNVDAARSGLDKANSELDQAQADYDNALNKLEEAEAAVERAEDAAEDAPRDQRRQARRDLRDAIDHYKTAEKNADKAESAIKNAEKLIEHAEKNLEKAIEKLEKTIEQGDKVQEDIAEAQEKLQQSQEKVDEARQRFNDAAQVAEAAREDVRSGEENLRQTGEDVADAKENLRAAGESLHQTQVDEQHASDRFERAKQSLAQRSHEMSIAFQSVDVARSELDALLQQNSTSGGVVNVLTEKTVVDSGHAYSLNFNHQDDGAFETVAGDSELVAGQMHLLPGDDGVAVAVMDNELLPERTATRVYTTVRADALPGLYKNGFIVFDYQSEDDFKYAGAWAGADRWAIGQAIDGEFSDIVTLDEEIKEGPAYELQVWIEGDTLTFLVEGHEKLTHTFDAAIDDGQIGVASYNARSRFDQVAVMQLHGGAGDVGIENVDVDGNADATDEAINQLF